LEPFQIGARAGLREAPAFGAEQRPTATVNDEFRPRRMVRRRRLSESQRFANAVTKFLARSQETSCAEARFEQIINLPNTHVPVVVCRSAGIWTRGQSTAPGRPAAGGEPAHPAKRGTRLEATTDRAFLVSAGPPKVGAQRGLSILPGVRTGFFLVQTMAVTA
jgi:hypothetical protein